MGINPEMGKIGGPRDSVHASVANTVWYLLSGDTKKYDTVSMKSWEKELITHLVGLVSELKSMMEWALVTNEDGACHYFYKVCLKSDRLCNMYHMMLKFS